MELIDDWQGKYPKLAPAQEIGKVLATHALGILAVHCYEDVKYPWVQIVFKQLIDPDVALRVGDALAAAVGIERVHFNSLRPRGVYFLLDPSFDPPLDLPASRYGEPLGTLKAAWNRLDVVGSPSRIPAGRRSAR